MVEWICAGRFRYPSKSLSQTSKLKKKNPPWSQTTGRVTLFLTNLNFVFLHQQPIFREQRSDINSKCAIKNLTATSLRKKEKPSRVSNHREGYLIPDHHQLYVSAPATNLLRAAQRHSHHKPLAAAASPLAASVSTPSEATLSADARAPAGW